MSRTDRIAEVVTENSGAVIVAMVLLTAAFGVGFGAIEESSSVSGLSDDSKVGEAYDRARSDFSNREANTTTTLVAVSNESGNALSKATLVRTLRYQRTVETNETISPTLADRRETVSVANVVARAAIAAERRGELCNCTIAGWEGGSRPNATATAPAAGDREPPTLAEQIDQLESMTPAQVTAIVERVLDPENNAVATRNAYQLLPREYDPGSTTATGHLVVMTQETQGTVRAAAAISDRVSSGQQAARAIAKDQSGSERYYVYSRGLVSNQQSEATSDSLSILGPLALLFVLLSLSIAYRDPVDVLLGLVGVGVVLVWTMGSLGWLGIPFNQTMIAVPIMLIGLSVDYALHVFMRYREERTEESEDSGVRPAMRRSLVGVGPALALVTATTAIGFLANVTSPLGDIRSFGVVSAIGIVATLFVFGLFVPALKTVVASFLGQYGYDRTPAPLGSTGVVRRILAAGATFAERAPLKSLGVALLITLGGVYGATYVEVATPQTAFMADEPPGWTDDLPEAVRPGEYFLKENRGYIYAQYQTPDKQGYVLVEGNVTAPGTLERVADAEAAAVESEAVFEGPSGEPSVVTPLSGMRRAAAGNETFNATYQAADTDGDGIPERNVNTLYDQYYAAAPDLATRTVHRTEDGEYTAMRIRVPLDGSVDRSAAVAPLDDAAAVFADLDKVEATATGQPVISKDLNDRLATTLVESLTLTLAVILGLLMVVFWRTEARASLGGVTLLPVVLSVSWLLGTMAVLDIPIGLITALVGSISVGLGVDYAIHITERFVEERSAGVDSAVALDRTVTGTGSALLSSAVTTAAGFGVLSFSLIPGLQQFGFILAVGIVYSFLASVYVQPNLLMLWDEYVSGGSTTAPERSLPGSQQTEHSLDDSVAGTGLLGTDDGSADPTLDLAGDEGPVGPVRVRFPIPGTAASGSTASADGTSMPSEGVRTNGDHTVPASTSTNGDSVTATDPSTAREADDELVTMTIGPAVGLLAARRAEVTPNVILDELLVTAADQYLSALVSGEPLVTAPTDGATVTDLDPALARVAETTIERSDDCQDLADLLVAVAVADSDPDELDRSLVVDGLGPYYSVAAGIAANEATDFERPGEVFETALTTYLGVEASDTDGPESEPVAAES